MIDSNKGYTPTKQQPIPKINVDYLPDRPMTKETTEDARYQAIRPMSTEILRNLKRDKS